MDREKRYRQFKQIDIIAGQNNLAHRPAINRFRFNGIGKPSIKTLVDFAIGTIKGRANTLATIGNA